MTTTPLPLSGGCGCGAVRFEVRAPLVSASYCHCSCCRRRTGTAASPQARTQQWRQFVAYAADWEPIPDGGLPRYREARP
jgi:hypothetical protein